MKSKLTLLNAGCYFCMIVVNVLALQIPFFGRTPGEVSDLYPHMLTPADFSFSIWSVIYILLGVFIVYGFKLDVDFIGVDDINKFYCIMKANGHI